MDRMLPRPIPADASVSVVVPALNEERYIGACVESLLTQQPGERIEILVVDGGSSDATCDIVRKLQQRHVGVRLLNNPGRIQSAGINLVARMAAPQSSVLLRADAHALYPPDFVRTCLAALRDSGASSVVVPMRTLGHDGFQRAVAAAQNSRLGNGGSPHRSAGASRFVEHGHHAAFDRRFFLALGGYDERFTHNEDAEFDHRLRLAGGRIWLCCEAAVTYFPRRDPAGLAKQYYRHGRGRARMLLLHRIRPQMRQLAPLLALATLAGGFALTPLEPVFALGPALYFGLCAGWGAGAALRRRDPWLLAMGAAAVIMHLSWATGFLAACADLGWFRRSPPAGALASPDGPRPLAHGTSAG